MRTHATDSKVRNLYLNNPLIHKDRTRKEASPWVKSFNCAHLRPLIVCRGPIRKETMDVLQEMGVTHYGILLSEKDSIVYPQALAPELRILTDNSRVHRVPDYSGAGKEERDARIRQIISIAKDPRNDYDSVFAGYGFMAEDEDFVRAIEQAGLVFIGPGSTTVKRAGRKDEAKRTALEIEAGVTPGVNNATARTLLKIHPTREDLIALCGREGFNLNPAAFKDLDELAEAVLNASYEKGIDLFSTEDLCAQIQADVADMFRRFPQNRVRLKAIGGGGGKGQRILAAPSAEGDRDTAVEAAASKAPEMVLEILNETKSNGVGDNKNILIELNIEQTRHNEIQLVGNGSWCVALGGRDCSVQMHEQKLLEVSMIREAIEAEMVEADRVGNRALWTSLKEDFDALIHMEQDAARFGQTVGLDSVSTYECIVERGRHFFMEVNTRIQVEHRVTELCYLLKFTNPDDPNDFFIVDSLVEMMVLLAAHKQRLPKPERIWRETASVEARLNATDASLAPHAGGIIKYWSEPITEEIRDDQGICLTNPDTGLFMTYKVAGAYDSNIALLITRGGDRRASYERLAEIIRVTKLEGEDLATNLGFHYGLVNWFLGWHVWAKPTTRFVLPYLTMMGYLKKEAEQIDLPLAYHELAARLLKAADKIYMTEADGKSQVEARASILAAKETLLQRPLKKLLSDPHFISGWLSINRQAFIFEMDRVVWRRNPVRLLAELYHYLNMDFRLDLPPMEVIWEHDNDLLQEAVAFYDELENRLGLDSLAEGRYDALLSALAEEVPPQDLDMDLWQKIRAAHEGYQLGLDILGILPALAREACFYDLRVEADMTISIPEHLLEPGLQGRMRKALAPPPVTKADEIAAVSGGMYYAQEAPGLPHFVEEGMHFEKGDPLYIIEVMKMFNKVYAPFSGTIDKILVESGDGIIVSKGQPLFKVTPDEAFVESDPVEVARRRREKTLSFLDAAYPMPA